VFDAIRYFKEELEWDKMFDFVDAQRRITNGEIMYVGMIDCDLFGYVWFKDLDNDRKLYNLFVRNQVEDKKYTGKEFLSDVIYRFENNKTIYCEVDEWNTKSLRLFERLGFRVQ
jgi:RimJ/RimL family protein N-acetyltransferase